MSARSPQKDANPITRGYFTSWLWNVSLGGYNTVDIGDSPIWAGSRSPTSEVNRTTGAVLPAGSLVSGTDGIQYSVNTSGTPRALAFSGIAQSWTGLQTFGDGIATDTAQGTSDFGQRCAVVASNSDAATWSA